MLHTLSPNTGRAVSILGNSPWSHRIRNEINRCAVYDSTVLITGPTGTGKEVIARSLHQQSKRAERVFVPVDCTCISGSLFASQLFGHRKGAFTGADYEALGSFRAAHGGTLFLDEIGELELDLQAKLLRVLQERCVIPLGSSDSVPADVRLVAATNRDLKREVMAGRFREDLYFRLNVVNLETVGLRERSEDVPPLAEHFLDRLAEFGGFPRKRLSPGALEMLTSFSWPGNVRQLRHVLEQAIITSNEELITLPVVQSILERARMPQAEGAPSKTSADNFGSQAAARVALPDRDPGDPRRLSAGEALAAPNRAEQTSKWTTLARLEREHICFTLEHTFYNQTATARLLDITRHALIRKLKRHNIELPQTSRSKRPR